MRHKMLIDDTGTVVIIDRDEILYTYQNKGLRNLKIYFKNDDRVCDLFMNVDNFYLWLLSTDPPTPRI